MQEKRLHLHYFMLTYTLPLENRHFLTEFSDVQKLKMAIYKGLVISEEQKYPKIRVVDYRFFKFLRTFKGTLRAFLGHSRRDTACRVLWCLKALQIKGYMSLRGAKRRGNLITPSLFLFLCLYYII